MNPSVKKAGRLLQVEALLLANYPNAMTQAEVARRLGVDRSTINRYLTDLPDSIYMDDDGRLSINIKASMVNLRLNLDETLAIHLGARLMATRMDRHNPHAAAALRKLAIAVEGLTPHLYRHLLAAANTMDDPTMQRQDPVFREVLETLNLGWATGRKVWVDHQPAGETRIVPYLFSVYFIEPYAVGQSTHVIGRREPPGELRTFKVERIAGATLAEQTYEIPIDFNAQALLRQAWGIWYTERPPVTVRLRFAASVASRVRESRWHPTENTQELPDGRLDWLAEIAEPREMLPWIRGWGADVEVLEPPELRSALKREARGLAELYGLYQPASARPVFYGHTRDGFDESDWQLLRDHLLSTATLAAELSQDAGVSSLAYVAGLLHDIGKYSAAFQARLRGSQRLVDHSTAGAREVIKLFPSNPYAEVLSFCIAGHHTGLPDYGSQADISEDPTLVARRDKKKIEDYSAYITEIDTSAVTLVPPVLKLHPDHKLFSKSFVARMVFSALVDADWLDTEQFVRGGSPSRGGYAGLPELYARFNAHMSRFADAQGPVNLKRAEIYQRCIEKADLPPGFFTLTVPTGGGKTLASMGFALKHAIAHGLKRIIYVIPFTSIIEQNAAVFKAAVGDENVLEHHSNFDWAATQKLTSSKDETISAYEKLRLASENWDIPIVVTTNVQFFESLFSNQKSRARKLHNIAKSVIIFDEAQMLPRSYLTPSMSAVWELVQNYGASAVFCTATQPALERFLPNGTTITELAPDPPHLFEYFRRVTIVDIGERSDEELAADLCAHSQVLCIVNTRKHAQILFSQLVSVVDDPDSCFHLSTLMCPEHRLKTLKTIRERLAQGAACRVISTQVVEAGVDLDFKVGYRAIAGLDSIIQAAGRVNREGRYSDGTMHVFRPNSPSIKRTPTFVAQGSSVATTILRDFKPDPISPDAVQRYFDLLYTLQGKDVFDSKRIMKCFSNGTKFEFAEAARAFRLIESDTVPIIIPFDKQAEVLIDELRYTPYPLSTLRKLQRYTITVYPNEFDAIAKLGAIQRIKEDYAVLDINLTSGPYYHDRTGLIVPTMERSDAIFFDG